MRLLTEDEAKHIICPIRAGGESKCLGTKCMGWQWEHDDPKEFKLVQVPKGTTYASELEPPPGCGWKLDRSHISRIFEADKLRAYSTGAWVRWTRSWTAERRGFCSPCESKVSEVSVG